MKFDFNDPDFIYTFSIPFGFLAMLKGMPIGYSVGGVGGAIVAGAISYFIGATVGMMVFHIIIFIGICFIPVFQFPLVFAAIIAILFLIFVLWNVKI